MEQSFSALIRRPQTLEIRLRPVYPLENNELYALLYDPRGNILMQSVLPTDELSPYTGIQLEDVPHLKPGTEYRLVHSSRAPSEDFSPLALLDAAGADCIIHASTPFDEISLDFYVHGVQLHRTYFAYLLACALGSILLLLLEVTLKKRALRILSYLAVGGAVMLSSLEAVQLLQEAHIYTLPPLPLSCPALSGVLCAAFLAVSTRLSFAAAASSTIVIVLALANHYTYLLRHSILTPADLLALGTAINVLDNYRLELSFPVIISLSSFGWILFPASLCCACSITGADCPKSAYSQARSACLSAFWVCSLFVRAISFFEMVSSPLCGILKQLRPAMGSL